MFEVTHKEILISRGTVFIVNIINNVIIKNLRIISFMFIYLLNILKDFPFKLQLVLMVVGIIVIKFPENPIF